MFAIYTDYSAVNFMKGGFVMKDLMWSMDRVFITLIICYTVYQTAKLFS